MTSPTTTSRRRRRGTMLIGALTIVSACSGGDEPSIFEARDPVDVSAVVATPAARWGTGYAVAAHPIPDEQTAIVTSAGVYLDDGGDTALEIEVFEGSAQIHTTAVTADGSTLVVATNSPATLRWYDLIEVAPTSAVDLGIEGSILEFTFVEPSNRLVAVTASGLASWDVNAPDAPSTSLTTEATGEIAVIAGRVVAPVLGTNEILLTDGVTVERRALELADGATVLGAKASHDQATLAVTSGVGPNEFERTDNIDVLDAATLDSVGTIVFDRPLRSLEWAVTTDAVAVSNGAELSITSLSGEPIATATPLPDDPIQSVLSTDLGVVTVHRSGGIVNWPAGDWSPTAVGESNVTLRFAEAASAQLTAVDFDGAITYWNLADSTRDDDDRFATGEATASAISADGDRVAVATAAGHAIVLDDELDEQESVVIDGRSPRVDTVEFNPESRQLVTGLAERLGELAFDDSVTLWDQDTLTPATTIGGESEDVAGCGFFFNRVGFTPDGELMSTVSHDFSVALHDGETGDYIVTLEPFGSTVLDTDFSITGDLLVASSDDSTVRVWDTEDFEELASYVSAPGGLQAFELLPDDSTLIAADLSGRLLVMDIMSGEILEVLGELGSRSTTLALSADGGLVAAPMGDGTLGLWSTTSGQLLTTLAGHAGTITDVEFAPDGEWIVTASRDGTVRKWDLETTTT